jgi:hypothetical protein
MRYAIFPSLVLMLILSVVKSLGQRGNIWHFGHEAGIDFNSQVSPTPTTSHLITRGSCATISDKTGQLLFTAAPDTDWLSTGYLYNLEINRPDGTIMPGGDSLVGAAWYYETTIIPSPYDTSKYYVFSIGVTTTYGLYYHIVDMSLDSGKGEITQKNVQLLNIRMVDCLLAVKHGNGRDWWVIVRESTFHLGTSNNSWYVYLITPNGISGQNVQNIGSVNPTNSGRLTYDTLSNKICFVNSVSLIELYDFDRCSGVLTNPETVIPTQQFQPYPWLWSCEFSPSGQFLYVGGYMWNDSSYLWQFDTWASNVAATKTLIWQSNYPVYYVIGQLKRAPDGKIYLSNGWVDTTGNYQFPYLSNQYYPENMSLSVINSPDLPGAACNFQPYSFYLGGKRTYWGLPNNPDYDLGPLVGSPCDTLVSINEPVSSKNAEMFVYYTSNWQTAFINAQHVAGNRYSLEVFDIMGKSVFRESGALNPPYFTKNLNCSSFAKGVYTVVLITEKERLVNRFVKE